jgi:hypothetical protein
MTVHAANEGESQQGVLVGLSDGTIRLMSSAGTESIVGTILTPAIGGTGWQFMYKVTVEYLSRDFVTLTMLAPDVNNGSYGPPPVLLPTTNGQTTKFTFKVGANKWKLLWFQFTSDDPTFQISLDGLVAQVKAWGSDGYFRSVMPFRPSGGEGGEP